jgi:hypothetical protein
MVDEERLTIKSRYALKNTRVDGARAPAVLVVGDLSSQQGAGMTGQALLVTFRHAMRPIPVHSRNGILLRVTASIRSIFPFVKNEAEEWHLVLSLYSL